MNDDVIGGIIRVLKYNGREDLANLFVNSNCKIEASSTYGSYWNSVLGTLEIYSPYKAYKKLNQLSQEEKNKILNAVLEIIPPKEGSIEIKYIDFFYDMKLDGNNSENEINANNDFNSKLPSIGNIDMNDFWNALKAYIKEIEFAKGYFFNGFNGYRVRKIGGGEYWQIDHYKLKNCMMQDLGKGDYPLENLPENKIIIKLIEFFYKHVSIPENNDISTARYEYTIRINKLFDNFNLPLKLSKGNVTSKDSPILSNLLKIEDLTYLNNDPVLNNLINEAVIFFTNSQQINIYTALEKIANSLERIKTIFEGSDKKKSTKKIIELLSKDANIRNFLDDHIMKLTFISNNYLIRHKEYNQKSLDSGELKQFLFYEYFNIIRFILKKIDLEPIEKQELMNRNINEVWKVGTNNWKL